MTGSGNVVQAPLAGVEPALLNAVAWERRWTSRADSTANAEAALKTAQESAGERARVAMGLAKRTLAWQAKWRGDFDASLKYCLEVEEHLSEVTHPAARADVYSILGVIHYSRNRLDLAGCAVQRGFHILENQDGTPSASAMVDLLATHATIQRYSGDNARVGITLGRALELASSQEKSRIDQNIARWLMADGEHEKALEHAERALSGAIGTRNRVVLPYAYEVLGAALSRLRRYDEAAEAFGKGLEIGKADEDRRVQCQIVQEHGAMHMAAGNPMAARDQFRKGARLAKDMGYGLWQKTFALGLADAYERLGDLRAALDQHKAAWRLQKQAR